MVGGPGQFRLEEREEGFYVLLPPDSESALDIAYTIHDRGMMTLAQRRQERQASLIEPTFTELAGFQVEGYIEEGTLGRGYSEG